MKRRIILFFVVVSLILFVGFAGAEEEASKWDTAGKEIKEAAKALKDATADSTQKVGETVKETSKKTVETIKTTSKGLLETAKEKSEKLVDGAKEKVHDATAPN